MLRESYEEAKKLLKENRELMDKLAAHLIEKETITGKEFMKIYRQEKGIPEPEEDDKKKEDKKDDEQNVAEQNVAESVSAEMTGEANQEAANQEIPSEPEMPMQEQPEAPQSDVGLFSQAEMPSSQNQNE